MYLQELNSIRKTQFDLENFIKQRARSNPSFIIEIKLLFEIITHDVLHLQSSMLKEFRGLEIQVSTFGAFLSNKLEISQKLSDLSAFQAQFNIILEIQADLEKQLRKKKWYKNTIDLVVRVFPSVSEQSNSVLQNQVLVSEKSIRNPKRKIEKEKTIILPENINLVETEQNNDTNPNLPKKRIDEISLSSHSYCPVAIEEQIHESSLPHSVSLSQDMMSIHTQDNYVNKLISSNTIIDSPSKTMDLSQTLPISSLSINQTQTQDNFSSMLFDCTDIFPIKTGHGSLMESQSSMLITNSPILGQKNNHGNFINRDITLQSQEIQALTQSQEISQNDQPWIQTENITKGSAESTNIETSLNITDSITVSEDTGSKYISVNNTTIVPNSAQKLESMKMSLNKHDAINLNSNQSGLVGIIPKKQCKQNKSNIHFLGNLRQKESFGKSMICKQKKFTDIPKQASSQMQFDFIFPTKQKSILHYVSPPRKNVNNLEITNRLENEIFEETNLSSLKNQKNSDRALQNKINTNNRKLNTRSFYKLSVLMISRDEITYDFPTTIWESENLPEEVIAQLELDLNFW